MVMMHFFFYSSVSMGLDVTVPLESSMPAMWCLVIVPPICRVLLDDLPVSGGGHDAQPVPWLPGGIMNSLFVCQTLSAVAE